MGGRPDAERLRSALSAAWSAHHDYESRYLAGVRDEQWAGWYAAYVLGRLGDFTTPTDLARWLEAVPGGDDWVADAADLVIERMGAS